MALPLVPILVGVFKPLLTGLVVWASTKIFSKLLALGVFGLVYVGSDYLIDWIAGRILQSFSGAPKTVLDFVMLCGFGEVLNILLSAISMGFVLKSAKSTGLLGE